MKCRRVSAASLMMMAVPVLAIGTAMPALGLANRAFVSARSGSDANACNNVNTPCKTFAGAVVQLSPDAVVIVLDSGGYGSVTITQGVTIEAPAGVTALISPTAGDAITVNAPSSTVTLRGLTLLGRGGTPGGDITNGIMVLSVGTLNVEHCSISGFIFGGGIGMASPGVLNVTDTNIKACWMGIQLGGQTGHIQASIDHCHLDGNFGTGFIASTFSPGSSTSIATYSTANNNVSSGWYCSGGSSGKDVLNLEFCSGSGNGVEGLGGWSANAQSAARFSNCVFANNGNWGIQWEGVSALESRGNNTITGNGIAPILGTLGSYSPM